MSEIKLNWRVRYQVEILTPTGHYIYGSVVTDLPIQEWAKKKKVAITVHKEKLAGDHEFTILKHVAFLPPLE